MIQKNIWLQLLLFFCCEISAFLPFPGGDARILYHVKHYSVQSTSSSSPRSPELCLAKTKKWDERYAELVNYHRKYNSTDIVGESNSTTVLKNFLQHQRQEYRKWKRGEPSSLDETKIELLNKIHFVWDKNQQIWDRRYDELLQFKHKFGHVNVPMKYKTLGQWVTKHRKAYHAGTLEQRRIDRLNEVGFMWDVKEWQFQRRLDEVRAFRAKNGHIDIRVTDGEFGSWFYSRRKEYLQYLNGENTTLSESHRLALEEVGFGVHLTERRQTTIHSNVTWQSRYEELVLFKEKFNHTRVPKIPKYAQLSSWVNHQRNLKAIGKLDRSRLLQLQEIGFVWNENQWLWMKRYSELAAFQEKRGHTNVPRGGGDLGEWVEWQRVSLCSCFVRHDPFPAGTAHS
jgi:Helicase associated domain